MRKAHISGNNESGNPNHWILDSGASEHFTPYEYILINYKTLDEPVEVNTVKGKLLGIGTGNVHLIVKGQGSNFTPITLQKVLYVPRMDSNLLFRNVLLRKGFEISMHLIKRTNILLGTYIIAKTVPHSKLWRLKTIDNRDELEYVLKMVGPKPKEPQLLKAFLYNIWHHCFAHLGPTNLEKLQKLFEGMAIKLKTIPKEGYNCKVCISGSQSYNLRDAPMMR